MIFDMKSYRRESPTVEQQARDRVAEQLRDKVTTTILAQAKARAVRSVIGGQALEKSIKSAVAWALHADHGPDNLPPVA